MLFLLSVLGSALVMMASAYAVLALLVRRPGTNVGGVWKAMPAVSVLKPLCGMEEGLERNLATLCVQTHPDYQIVFGVRDPCDPAIAVVSGLRARYPRCVIDLVVDPRLHGSNFKVSNLINMLPRARHELIVVADSDISVPTDYLERVVAPLADSSVGLVTCLYQGRPLPYLWSRVGALFIDTWFVPSVRLAHAFGARSFGFGATLALRRASLVAAGGFEALRNRLADDYWLGQLVRQQGLATVVSDVCVTTDVNETRLQDLWIRELRWLRTIRSLNPPGFFFTFITYTLPAVAIGGALSPSLLNAGIASVGIFARLGLHWRRPAPGLPRPGGARYAPLRDLLLLAGWSRALLGSHVEWREQIVPLQDGSADPYP